MNSGSDPYAVLMVRRGATEQEIRAAFKTLIGRWHPDITASPEAHHRSAAIIQAYRALSKMNRRSCADRRCRATPASVTPISPVPERRQGERRATRAHRLSQARQIAMLAWATVASFMVASIVAPEVTTRSTDELQLGALPS